MNGAYNPHDDRCLVENFFIVRSGFLQHKGSAGSGCTAIAGELSFLYGGHRNRIELEPWDACPSQTAEYVYRLGTKQQAPRVCIFAYSWGAGYGFVRLAEELQRRGIEVHTAVLCDPVYYGLDVWRAMLPRALFHRIWISVPANVRRVHWFRQFVNKPAGHDLKAEGQFTRISDPVVLDCRHQDADNAPAFRQKCLDVAWGVVNAGSGNGSRR